MSVADNKTPAYGDQVARWQENSRGRMQQAALRLFAEQGYDETTAQQVADAAGVSQRTFFRHFRDKEEVLFAADDHLMAAIRSGVDRVPADAAPLAVVLAGLRSLTAELEQMGDELRTRADIISRHASLTGRDLAKQARWAAALADDLVARGVDRHRALGLTGATAAAFRVAFSRWLADARPPGLAARVERAVRDLADDLAGDPTDEPAPDPAGD